MSKAGFNIRRLISQRQPKHADEDYDSDEGGRAHSSQESRKESWLMRRSQSTKQPPAPIIISRPQSVHNVLTPLPPLPDETPRSSASSVCSCEQHGEFASPRFAGIRRSPLCSLSSKDERSECSPQLSSATTYAGEDISPRFPLKDPVQSPPHTKRHKAGPSSSRLGFMEALSLEPEDKAASPDHRVCGKDDPLSSTLPDNITQLIRETDEAFQAAGSALAEVYVARMSFNETPKLAPLVVAESPTLKPILNLKSSRHKHQQRLAIPPLASPTRNPSVSRIKRNKSKKLKQMKPHRKTQPTRNAVKNSSRWTLTDNVTDLFSGHLFKKIEADEMLTPAELEAYKLRRQSKLQLETQGSTETLHRLGGPESTADTPIEPFHMDDLPLRIGSSGLTLAASTPVGNKPAAASFDSAVKRDFSAERKDEKVCWEALQTPERPSSGQENAMAYRNVTFPMPPIRGPLRYMSRKQLPALPSIPEIGPVLHDELFRENSPKASRETVADADYIFLRSSPCTITAPIFRHGPIRLAKSDLHPDPVIGVDEGLDWTAFQIAISSAGDLYSESEDTIRRWEQEDLETLFAWWDDLHLDGAGELITKEPEVHSPTSTISGGDCSDFSYSEIENDNPYSARHKWQCLKNEKASKGQNLDLNLSRHASNKYSLDGYDPHSLYNDEGGKRRWTAESEANPYVNRESLGSLPESPMPDLDFGKSEVGDVDVVPMGYNLGHDLGDFLQWEAQNVYADHNLWDGGVI
ncbi:uncharacterized protein BCR38DRAFT_453515 [Pseudomassariella vexata]|uniref:Uncharacterized protein n=1 Tax=Pseudomassariella vexata TaxID=1141098 RepID=A0A1Y2D5Z3_9PEZI|nr:uncharacterized protein BCR38DRAFT_453515 [Pseudomassariella vexata]ORY54574.1 hypothetical protein BCR38DRAFT_453515 [Pseudomassariella vexata]